MSGLVARTVIFRGRFAPTEKMKDFSGSLGFLSVTEAKKCSGAPPPNPQIKKILKSQGTLGDLAKKMDFPSPGSLFLLRFSFHEVCTVPSSVIGVCGVLLC